MSDKIENEIDDIDLEELEIDDLDIDLDDLDEEEIETLNAILAEDGVQLDELSKKTLGSYIKKASASLGHRQSEADRAESELIKQNSKENRTDLAKKSRKAAKRYTGITRAADKLTKEDFDLTLDDLSEEELVTLGEMLDEDGVQLDELSKKTLGNYIRKAARNMERSTQLATLHGSGTEKGKKFSRRSDKRDDGISQAVKKLTKEETEMEETEVELTLDDLDESQLETFNDMLEEDGVQLDELSKKTLGNYIKKAVDDKKYHDAMADTYARAGETRRTRKHFTKGMNRRSGISKATDRLTKEDLDEATTAANTLRPKGAGGESKAETLATFTSLLAQLGKEDLSSIFNQVQAQFGENKAPGAVDKSSTNVNTIKAKSSAAQGTGPMAAMPMPKLIVREDIDEMFASDELSEDFKDRAEVIFEAALNTRLELELAKLNEEFEELEDELIEAYNTEFDKELETFTENLEDRISLYLDDLTERWMDENSLAVDTSLRNELSESFIKSLKGVFEEHYIEMPEEKYDFVKNIQEELAALKEELNAQLDENVELRGRLMTADVDSVLSDLSEGLTVTQANKLQQLSEGLEYDSVDTFKRKLELIKENYFTKKPASTGLLNETIDGEDTSAPEAGLDPVMATYASAISKNNK